MAAVVARRGAGTRVGVSLAATTVCAAIQRPGESRVHAWRMSLAPLNGDGAGWPGLTEALRALARDAGVSDGRLTVALMPPLAEARGIDTPPLNDAELQQLLARSAGKYFVAARGAQVVGAVRNQRRAGGISSTVAAAAAARLVNAIHESANAAGWSVDAVIPAEAAWGAAAASWAARGRASAQLLVAHPDRTDLLHVSNAKLVGLRRFRGGSADAALIAEAASQSAGVVSVVGSPEARRELTRSLSSRGITVDTPATAVSEIADEPDLLAAAFASRDAEPALVTDAVRATRAEAARRVVGRVAVATGLLLLTAAALELWGTRRELAAIDAQRTELNSQIATTLVGTTTVETAYRQLAALNTLERTAPRWSSVIAQLTDRLPKEAYFMGFRGRGDTVSVDGYAVHAARVFDAIEKVPALVDVRATAPVRIENMEDGGTLERFTIAGRVAGAKPAATRPAPRQAAPPAAKAGGR